MCHRMESQPSSYLETDALSVAMNLSSGVATGLPIEASGTNPDEAPSEDIDLTLLLGPRRQELGKVISMTTIYCLIFVTGLVGNVSTCLVIASNRYMQTATNYYLFNLAVSDLMMLVLGLPQETYSFWSAYPWVFGETLCVLRTMCAETSTYSSILTITSFTVERYVAICHPMKTQIMSSLGRAVKMIAGIWVVSWVCSLPIVAQYGVVYMNDTNGRIIDDSATCNIRTDRYVQRAFETSTFLFFFAPMTIITVLYVLIGLTVRKSTLKRTGSDTSRSGRQDLVDEKQMTRPAAARKSVLKMLVAVVIAFFICWAPFHTQRLMSIYMESSDDRGTSTAVQSLLFFVSGILYYVSSVINPILYNIMSLKFRNSFRTTILRPCTRLAQPRPPKLTYRYRSRTAAIPTSPARPTTDSRPPLSPPPPPRLAIVRVTGSRSDMSDRCDVDPTASCTSTDDQLLSGELGLRRLAATENTVCKFASSRRRHFLSSRGALRSKGAVGEGRFVEAGEPTSVQSVEEGKERKTVVMISVSRPWHSCV